MAFEGVILDVDGTLVSSNDAHAQAWVEAFSNYGYDVPFEQVRPLIGMGGDQVIPRLVSELNGKDGVGKQIADRRKDLILDKFGAGIAPTSGARELVEKLRKDSLHLIVASSATEPEMDLLLRVAQVDDLLSEFTTSDDADESKPQPDLIEAALSKAHLQPDRTVMLGDTPYDIEAAEKAGVSVIAFRSGGFNDEQLQGAIAIYDDPADLLRHYETSPLATSTPTTATATDESLLLNESAISDEIVMPDDSITPSASMNESMQASWQSMQTQATTLFANATDAATTFFQNNRRLLTTLGWLLLALLGFRLLLGALDAFDDIPLVSPALKLIGFIYVVRFTWRYLIRQHDRQELMETIKRTKADVFGQQH